MLRYEEPGHLRVVTGRYVSMSAIGTARKEQRPDREARALWDHLSVGARVASNDGAGPSTGTSQRRPRQRSDFLQRKLRYN